MSLKKYIVAGLISLIVVSPAFAGRRSRGGCSSGSCGASAGFSSSSSCASGACSSVESFSGSTSCADGSCSVTQSAQVVQTTPMTAVPAGTKTVTYALLNGSWVVISTSDKGCPCPNCTGECANCPNGKCTTKEAAKKVSRVGNEHSSLPKAAYDLFGGKPMLELVKN